MPAPRLYLGSREIAEILGICRREAQYMMQMFTQRGQTVTQGRAVRVSLKHFAAYLAAQDGSDPKEVFETIKAALKTA